MGFANIDADTLERLRATGARVVDVRSDLEVARGIIPGASHIAMDKLPMHIGEMDRGAPIVLYCQVGARSAGAAQFLVSQGFQQVYNLQGGMTGWMARGRPVGHLS